MNELVESPLGAIEEGKVFPKYIWKTGTTFFLSKTETIIAETFLSTRSYAACIRALGKEGIEKDIQSVKKSLEKEHVLEYLAEQFDERGVTSGWTQEHWLKVMTDHIQGVKRLKNGDLYAMKLIGDHKGFFEKSEINIFNQPIQITQANGTI